MTGPIQVLLVKDEEILSAIIREILVWTADGSETCRLIVIPHCLSF
jgi:hypothetical protein